MANANTNTVTLIDTSSFTAIAHVDLDDTPAGVAIAPDGRYAYVTLAASHVMAAIDLAARAAVSPAIPVGAYRRSVRQIGPPIMVPDAQQPARRSPFETTPI